MGIFRARRATMVIGAILVFNHVLFAVYLLKEASLRELECQTGPALHTSSDVITALKKNISHLEQQLQARSKATDPAHKHSSALTPIYMITPTYTRWTQKADLTRICQTLMHVPSLHWLLVEDAEQKTRLVSQFLEQCEVKSTHLNVRTEEQRRLKPNEPVWRKARGVEQRNLAVDWLRKSAAEGKIPRTGTVYFGDDDNTYDIQIFEEMRETRKVSVWLVGICGQLRFEGPICSNGKVSGWYTGWGFDRPFQIDMAGFAVSLELLLSHPQAYIDPNAARGWLESSLLEKLVTMEDLEPKGDCKKVWVWHTRTEVPKMKHEDELIKKGKPSNPLIET